jgi:5-formyltetrahydrofolate cyclo-ligase
LCPELAGKWSEWAQRHLLGAFCFQQARTIGLYAAFDHEVDTRLVFEGGLKQGKTMAFPRVMGEGEMVYLRETNWQKMVENKWGILEPSPDSLQVAVSELELVVVPGVAFARNGCRLGFGGGYYDRLLSRLEPDALTVGLAYSFQVLDNLPCEASDQKVKRIVTEQGFLKMCP